MIAASQFKDTKCDLSITGRKGIKIYILKRRRVKQKKDYVWQKTKRNRWKCKPFMCVWHKTIANFTTQNEQRK